MKRPTQLYRTADARFSLTESCTYPRLLRRPDVLISTRDRVSITFRAPVGEQITVVQRLAKRVQGHAAAGRFFSSFHQVGMLACTALQHWA